MQIFDYSQLHYHNLERLLLQGKAQQNGNLISYSFKYLNLLNKIEKLKIESLTRYFIENFENLKKKKKRRIRKRKFRR